MHSARRFLPSIEGLVVIHVIVAACLIALYVHNTMNRVRQALPGEVLNQQQDIAYILQDLSELKLAVRIGQLDSKAAHIDSIREQIRVATDRLRSVRQTYRFDSRVGASAAHAVANPALQDMERWMDQGLAGHGPHTPIVLSFVEQRVEGAHRQVQEIFDDANASAASLIATETENLEQFRYGMFLSLGVFPIFAVGLVFLFVRKRSLEAGLQESEERFRSAFEAGGVGVALLHPDGPFLHCNGALQDFLGYCEEELLQMHLTDIVHPDDLALCQEQWQSLLLGESTNFQSERRYRHKQGHDVWGLATVSLHRNPDGSPRRIISQVQDISEQKRAEVALGEREEQYQKVFETTSDGLFVFSASNKLEDVNPAGCAMHGRSKDEMLALDPKALLHPDSQAVFGELIDAISSGRKLHAEAVGLRGDGTVFDTVIDGGPYYLRGELHFLVSMRDVTERKRAEEALARSVKELESFAYSVAHDLKAPLRAMQGFSEILQEDYRERFDEAGRRYLTHVADGAIRMGVLIDDLLEYSRVGRGTGSFEAVDLAGVLRQVEANLANDIEGSGAVIKRQGILPTIEGHRATLEQVFQNLVANAIKFTVPGTKPQVTVCTREEKGWYVVSISDNGIGIDEVHRRRVFDIFQRLHTTEQYAGTGIGLAMVQKGVQVHGGTVWVEANPEGGSTFFIRIPNVPLAAVA